MSNTPHLIAPDKLGPSYASIVNKQRTLAFCICSFFLTIEIQQFLYLNYGHYNDVYLYQSTLFSAWTFCNSNRFFIHIYIHQQRSPEHSQKMCLMSARIKNGICLVVHVKQHISYRNHIEYKTLFSIEPYNCTNVNKTEKNKRWKMSLLMVTTILDYCPYIYSQAISVVLMLCANIKCWLYKDIITLETNSQGIMLYQREQCINIDGQIVIKGLLHILKGFSALWVSFCALLIFRHNLNTTEISRLG